MAIARVAIPTPTSPTVLADYQAILDQLAGVNQALTGRAIADGSTIRAGTIMLVGGVLYKATSDTTITGTPSAYVKVTPAGASATAAFVSSLTGVTFNEAYGGYYDGSGNLYAFDEGQAVADGVITAPRTLTGLSAGPRMRTFTASGTFVVPTGVNFVWVTGCASGANGANGASTTSGGPGGAGGGQGSKVIKKKISVTPGTSITVTIGAVGADTTFGALLTLSHGVLGPGSGAGGITNNSAGGNALFRGGSGAPGSANCAGGGGGAESPLDGTVPGNNGASSTSSGGSGGAGGGGGGGGAGGNGVNGANGGNANAFGAGGGGGGSGNPGGTGGSGGPAIITVEW